MFVVHSQFPTGEPEDSAPFKAFSCMTDATAFAKAEVEGDAEMAFLYEVVGVSDARAAIDGVKIGRANLLIAHAPKGNEAQRKRADDAAWERAQREGADAVLRFLGL